MLGYAGRCPPTMRPDGRNPGPTPLAADPPEYPQAGCTQIYHHYTDRSAATAHQETVHADTVHSRAADWPDPLPKACSRSPVRKNHCAGRYPCAAHSAGDTRYPLEVMP